MLHKNHDTFMAISALKNKTVIRLIACNLLFLQAQVSAETIDVIKVASGILTQEVTLDGTLCKAE